MTATNPAPTAPANRSETQTEVPVLTETTTTATTRAQAGPGTQADRPVVNPGLQRISTIAMRLQMNGEALEVSNNEQPRLTIVNIQVDRLLQTFANILYPLVFGNFRSLGVKSSTDVNDVATLREVLYTASANAVQAAYAVMYTKAARGNFGVTTHFGGMPEADHFRFPSMLTALINSLGPVTRDTEPYQANFVPVMDYATTTNLLTDAKYQSYRFEQFLTGLQRARNILFTSVDVNTQESSTWWMLHVKRTGTTTAQEAFTGQLTVFNPIPFQEREPCTILAGLVIHETLYDLPGPLRTQTLGPFLAIKNPTFQDIPRQVRDGTAFNCNPFAFDHVFTQSPDEVTNAQAFTLFPEQGDTYKATEVADFMTEDAKIVIQDYINDQLSEPSTKKPASSKPGENALTEQTRKRPRSTQNINVQGANDPSTRFSNYHVTRCTIMWFNHILYTNFNARRTAGIVIEACRTDAASDER